MTPERGFAARWLRLFPFPLKIHFKGRQLPAGRGFSQNFFRFCNTGKGILATGGAEIFFLSLPTTPRFEICQTGRAIFSLLPTTDKNPKCQTPGQKNCPFTYYYNLNRAKWPGTEPGNKKSSKSFSDLLLSLAAGDGWYSVLKVWADWLDNLGFVYLTNWKLPSCNQS